MENIQRMKRLLFSLSALLTLTVGAQAQRLIIGEKVPEVRIARWQNERAPVVAGRAYLLDFFVSSNEQNVANLPRLEAFQEQYGERLNVIVVSREALEQIAPLFPADKRYSFYVGVDDGEKTFGGYGVRFVPFAALVDARGRLVWTGNVAALTRDIIEKALK
jgi:hypothetical protein